MIHRFTSNKLKLGLRTVRSRVWSTGFSLLLLAEFPVLAADNKEADHAAIMDAMRGQEEHVAIWQRYPSIGVPLMTASPTTDGVVDTREWGQAARVGPFIDYNQGLAVRDKTDLYLGYTATHLHLAFQFERPQNARRPADQDLFEILFDWAHGHAKYGNIGMNLERILWTGVGPNVVKTAWQPVAEYRARTTDYGWEGELAIPWKEFSRDGPPAPGTVWGADFVRNEKTPADRLAVWAFRGKNWHAVRNLGHLLFTGQPLAVRTAGVGWIEASGQRGVKLLVANFSDQPVTVTPFLELRRADARLALEYYPNIDTAMTEDLGAAIGSPLAKEVENTLKNYAVQKTGVDPVTVAPHTSQLVQLVETEEPGNYLASYALQTGDTLLAAGAVPFQVLVPLAVKLESYLYSAHTVAYSVDLRRVADKLTDTSMLTVEARAPTGQVLAHASHAALKGREEQAGTLRFAPQPDSTVIVRATIADAGQEVAANDEPLRVPPQPAWLGNQLGKKKFVPPPWKPVKANAKSTDMLLVNYDWDRKTLLPAVTHKNLDLLAAPPQLTFKDTSGNALPVKITRWKLARRDVEQATYAFEATVGGSARLTGNVTIEFDGLAWYTIQLAPQEKLELGAATLEFALNAPFNRLCTAGHGITATTNQNYSGAIPAEGMTFPFTYMFWVGGYEGGFQWFAEDNRHWRNANEKNAVQIARTDAGATLTINFVDTPVTLVRPLTWSFGFLPTPARPKPAGWGEFAFFQTGMLPTEDVEPPDPKYPDHWSKNNWYKYFSGDRWQHDKQFINCFIHHGYWQEIFGYPGTFETNRADTLTRSVRTLHGLGIQTIVYAGWGMNTAAPEWPDYGPEMVSLPLKNTGYGTFHQGLTTLWQDWFIAKMAGMIRDHDIDGIFIDSVTSVMEEQNYTGDMRWVDATGKLRGSYPLRAARDWLKRLYKLWHGERKQTGIVYNHHSPPAIMMIDNFADVRTPSEFAQNYDGPLDRKFLDYYVAKNGGEQFGLAIEHTSKDWMGAWAKRKTNQLYAFALPLNVAIKAVSLQVASTRPGYELDAQPQPWIWAANHWINRSTAQYLPWWKNADYLATTPADEQIIHALWLHQGRKALLCVSNLKNEPRDVRVSLKLDQLGFQNIAIEDALTGEAIPAEAGACTVHVDFERYRLLKITNQK